MPRVTDLYPKTSQWLKSEDIPDEGLTVTIDSYEVKDFNYEGKHERKPVLYFKEDVKPLIVIKTNAGTITQIVGSDELDDWIGRKITLVPREVEYSGKQVWSIRVHLPRRQNASRAATQAQAPARGRGARAAAELDEALQPPDDEIGQIDESSIPF